MKELFESYLNTKNGELIQTDANRYFRKEKKLNVNPKYPNLDFCYGRCSYAKKKAFEYCEKAIYDLKEKYDLRTINKGICSYNCMMFTYGAILVNDQYRVEVYITKSHDYIKMEER